MADTQLILPDESWFDEIRAYRQEMLDAGSSMDGCGPLRRMEQPEQWLRFCRDFMHEETIPVPDWVVCTQFIFVRPDERRIVGMLQVRHAFNDFLRDYGGHIGYSVRPSERRQGHAAHMLQAALPFCRQLGLDRVLITCLTDNEASRRTILRNGGVYESTVHEPQKHVDLERYWITL